MKIQVAFTPGGKQYTYDAGHLKPKVGDVVEVPGSKKSGGKERKATVVELNPVSAIIHCVRIIRIVPKEEL